MHILSSLLGRRRSTLAIAFVALSGACKIPTDAPVIDQSWTVPATSTQIAVDQLLPSSVTITSDSTGFLVTVPSASVTRSLGQDCASCAAANGAVIPKPAFVANVSTATTLPPEVVSATIATGTLQLNIKNNYNFDPLRPSAAAGSATGFAVITVSSGANVIGKDSVNGATTALGSGTTLIRSIPLSGSISGSSGVTIAMTLNSPAGDPVTINSALTIVASATVPQPIKITGVTVNVTGKSVTKAANFDLHSIDSTIIRHATGGTLLLAITNPFNVSGPFTLTLTPGTGAPIVRTINIAAGSSNVSATFSQAEIQRILGSNVAYTLTGTVNGASSIQITPKQVVAVTARFQVGLEVGTLK